MPNVVVSCTPAPDTGVVSDVSASDFAPSRVSHAIAAVADNRQIAIESLLDPSISMLRYLRPRDEMIQLRHRYGSAPLSRAAILALPRAEGRGTVSDPDVSAGAGDGCPG